MTTLRIIDRDFNLINEISSFESLQITNIFGGVGQLELKINRYLTGAEDLKINRIVFPTNRTDKPFIIRHREIELDENGKETENWNIIALSLRSLLSQRIIIPPPRTANDNKSGNAETVLKHYVSISAVNPIDSKRIIPKLVIASNLQRGDKVNRSARFDTLSEELATISTLTGTGWNISVDIINKQFVFDVVESTNHSAKQFTNNPVIFSPDFNSLESLDYTESYLDYKNMAYVAGQGEGIERRVITLNDDSEGFERYELYVDARDISETEDEDGTGEEGGEPPPRPVAEIEADLIDRGNEKLDELKQEIFMDGQILTKSPFLYERDYTEGDIVTVQHRAWGLELDARITEVKEVYESGNPMKIEVVFDNDKPTLIDKIKREFKALNPIKKT